MHGLFETVHAPSHAQDSRGALPYAGVPSAVVVDAGKLVDARGRPVLPAVAAETIVFDYADPPVMPTGSATTLVADVPGPLLTA